MKIQRVIPVSDQLRDILFERIQSGAYPAGERFPSESELCQEFELSRASVRTALAELEARGLLVRQSGIGTFVAGEHCLDTGLEQLESVLSIARRHGLATSTANLKITQEAADANLAARLNLAPGDAVTRVARAILVEGIPVSYHIDTVPACLLPAHQIQNFGGSVLDYLTGSLHLPVTNAKTEITAVTAQDSLCAHLSVEEGSAVILLKETLFDSADTPLGYSDNYFVPDRFRLQFFRRK